VCVNAEFTDLTKYGLRDGKLSYQRQFLMTKSDRNTAAYACFPILHLAAQKQLKNGRGTPYRFVALLGKSKVRAERAVGLISSGV